MHPAQAGHKQMSTAKLAEKEKGMKIYLNLKAEVFWGKIHRTFLGAGSKEEILRWPFPPRAAAGRLSRVWLQGSHELVASIGRGKWNAES